jgi:hypothetical protein
MSAAILYAIAILYLCSAISFAIDGNAPWTGLTCSWGIGNLILAYLAK